MGKKTLDPWIADCVWHELAAVVIWKREINNGIKADPESRFVDDGSNFRSTVSGQEQSLVQLIEVLSAVEPVRVILSDGVTKVKAHLSNEVVSVLARETEESFSSEVTGDVLQLRNFTVISTIFGPADDFVQLAVDDVEYEHHLRKVQGDPQPIEEDENVKLLIENITNLRCPPNLEEQTNVDTSGEKDPPHQPNVLASTLVPSTQSQFIQSGIESQYPASRTRQSGPTLDNEGFQVAEGLNLHRPLRAAPGSLASKGLPAVTTSKAKVLLGLLGQKQAAEGLPPPSPQLKTGQKRAREVSPPTPSLPQQSSTAQQKSSAVVAETPAKPTHRPVEVRSDSDPEPEGPSRPLHSRHVAPSASNQSPPSAQPPPQISCVKSAGSSGQSRIPYGRRKVPANQQKLLDDKSCWIPSQPGYRFPHPNVPIELLTRWNKTATPSPRKPRATQHDAARSIHRPESPHDISMHDEGLQSSATSPENSSDSEDEEFNSDEWPPSSPLRRPELPPDSSWDNDDVIRGTQHDDLEVALPRALPIRKSPTNPARRPVQHMRHALPPRPPVSIPGQAVMDSVSSPPTSHASASQQSLPPNSSFNASRPISSAPGRQASSVREGVQATPARAQSSSQPFDARPLGPQISAHGASRSQVSSGEAVTQNISPSALQSETGTQRSVPADSPATTGRAKRIEDYRNYLEPGFDPYSLSLSQMRGVLAAHDVAFPAAAKLSQLIDLFKRKIAPQARSPPGVGTHYSSSFRPHIDEQDSPVQSHGSLRSSYVTSSAKDNEGADAVLDPYHAIDTAETQQLQRLQQELEQTRLRIAKLERKKRRRAESAGQEQINQDPSASDITSPTMPTSEQSPPRSSFRNPTMVGRRPPNVQSSPVATPLQNPGPRHSAVDGSKGSSEGQLSTHGDADRTPRPTVSSPILSSRGRPAMSAEVNQPREVQQSSQIQRDMTRSATQSVSAARSTDPQARHPDEVHRLVRREHFGRSGRREQWINDNFQRVNHGNKTIASMFALYKEQHPEDKETDLDKITRAAQIVFRSSREALALAKFRRINLPTVPAANTVESRPGARSSTQSQEPPSRRNGSDSTSRQADGTSDRVALTSSPRGDRRSKAAPITQIDGADDRAHDTVSHTHSSPAANNHHRSALDERVAETLTNGSTSDALREFCQNWLNIQPGGAFAVTQFAPRRVRRNVDVLQWDV